MLNVNYVWIVITAVAFVGGLEVGYAYYLNNDPYSALMQNPESMNRFAGHLATSMMNSPQHQQMMDKMMSGGGMGGMGHNMTQSHDMGMSGGDMGMDHSVPQNHDMGMMERGNMAMGFDQTKIMHHFIATTTGGKIMIMALDGGDAKTISEIRAHVKDIQHEFSQGNFTRPFYIHAQVVPGTQVMAEKKDLIQYSTRQIEDGEVLVLTTHDAELLDAIKQFMDFQSSQHMGH